MRAFTSIMLAGLTVSPAYGQSVPSWDRIAWFLSQGDEAQIRTVVGLYEAGKLPPSDSQERLVIGMSLHQFYFPALLELVKTHPSTLSADQVDTYTANLADAINGVRTSQRLLNDVAFETLTGYRNDVAQRVQAVLRFQTSLLSEAEVRRAEVAADPTSIEVADIVREAARSSVEDGLIYSAILQPVRKLDGKFKAEADKIASLEKSIAKSYAKIQGLRRALVPMLEELGKFDRKQQDVEFGKLLDSIDDLLAENGFTTAAVDTDRRDAYPGILKGKSAEELLRMANDSDERIFPALELYRHLLSKRLTQMKAAKEEAETALRTMRKEDAAAVRARFGSKLVAYLQKNFDALKAVQVEEYLNIYKAQLKEGAGQ